MREYERDNTFNDNFIQMARSIYKLNDERASIKRYINECFNSIFVEEKSYE